MFLGMVYVRMVVLHIFSTIANLASGVFTNCNIDTDILHFTQPGMLIQTEA